MKKKDPSLPLPPPRDSGGETGRWGTVKTVRYSGRLGGKTPVAFSFLLFTGEGFGATLLLEEVAKEFLSFLQKESEKGERGVFFGGLSCRFSKEGILISAAFCPFSERNFTPVAVILLDEEGAITGIQQKKD